MTSSTRLTCVTGVVLVILAGLMYVAWTQFGAVPAEGLSRAGLAGLLLTAGGGLLLLGLLLFNELSVIRTAQLLAALRQAKQAEPGQRTVPVAGSDEVAELAGEVNELLATVDGLRHTHEATRASQQSLSAAAAGWAEVFGSSPVAQCVYGLTDLRCVAANKSFLALTGFSRDDLIGRAEADLPLWPQATARESWWHLVREQRSVRDVECALQQPGGKPLTVAAAAEVIMFDDAECVLWSLYDLTEREHRELHVRQMQKLEAITKLAAGFAHDFNNLLCVIQGHSSLLQSEPTLDPGCVTSLKAIATAAERGSNLTRQLLTFSRKQVIKAKSLDLNLVIHGMSNMLFRVLGEDVALRFDFSGDLPLIRADTGMIEQVVMNLVMNARDAMPRGGQLTVNTGAFTVDEHYVRLKPEAYVGRFACLSVSDTGCGLEPGAVNRIFEPFFTTKDVGKGTGLGLATVYGIVKQHQGWIEVTSQPGKGTTFKIFVPATDEPVETPVAKPAPFRPIGGQEKIFLVDDEPGLLALVQSILERYGYQVVTATNGRHALEVWETLQGKVDLLVTDVVMPEGMTGCELARKLRQQQPHLKVIFTSGYSSDLVAKAGEELVEGLNFIQKPYRPQVLAQTVRHQLDSHSPPKTGTSQAAA